MHQPCHVCRFTSASRKDEAVADGDADSQLQTDRPLGEDEFCQNEMR